MYKWIRPFLFTLPPEAAHNKTLKLLKNRFWPSHSRFFDECLMTQVCGMKFQNPVGLAAGFDKNAEVMDGTFRIGFGFVEVGTVTPKPQKGNPKPRIFRDTKTNSVINRMGFPNKGMEFFRKSLNAYRAHNQKPPGPIGVNIGMNKDQNKPEEDYVLLINELNSLASYFTINISSPNTPGLRDLQKKENLAPFLKTIMEARDKAEHKRPVFLKLSPDLDPAQIAEIAHTVVEQKIDGLILTNTTLERPDILSHEFAKEKGGLSGPQLREKSTHLIAEFFDLTDGQIPIIGVGGITDAEEAFDMIAAGASLLQLYTGLVFEGPGLPAKICEDLAILLKTYGYRSVADATGSRNKEFKQKQAV